MTTYYPATNYMHQGGWLDLNLNILNTTFMPLRQRIEEYENIVFAEVRESINEF